MIEAQKQIKQDPLTAYFSQLEHPIALGNPGVATKGHTIAYVHPMHRERAVVLLHGYSTKLARTIQLPSTSPLSRKMPKIAINNYAVRRLYESWHRQRPVAVELAVLGAACRSRTTSSHRCATAWLPIGAHPHILRAIDPETSRIFSRSDAGPHLC